MFKRLKSISLIVLCLTFILSSSIAFGADQNLLSPNQLFPYFNITVKGTLSKDTQSLNSFILTTANYDYRLTGNTKGMENYIGKKISAKGIIKEIFFKKQILVVQSYSPLSNAIKSEIVTVTGNLNLSNVEGKHYELTAKDNVYVLTGKTDGLDKYTQGQMLEVKGYISGKLLEVVSYTAIIPENKATKLQGTLSVRKNGQWFPYTIFLKTANVSYELVDKAGGLEKFDGQQIEVTGTLSTLNMPIFLVDSFAPVKSYEPIVTSSKIHTIVSDKYLYFFSPSVSVFDVSSCSLNISWSENTVKASFGAKLIVSEDSYEFELVSVKSCENDSITGLYTVSKNGKVIAKEIPGKLYGLSQPLGDYFHFGSDDMKWHICACITYRSDF